MADKHNKTKHEKLRAALRGNLQRRKGQARELRTDEPTAFMPKLRARALKPTDRDTSVSELTVTQKTNDPD